MENLDIAVGAAEVKNIKIGEVDYKLAPLGPYVVGQLIGFIKDRKRAEVAASAKAMGGISLKELNEVTNAELEQITIESIDQMSGDIDVMTKMIYFSMRVHHQSLMYSDMGKLLTTDNIAKIAEVLMSDFTEGEDQAETTSQ